MLGRQSIKFGYNARPNLAAMANYGFVWFSPLSAGQGATANDVIGGQNLLISQTTQLQTAWQRTYTGGDALNFSTTGAAAQTLTSVPAYLQLQLPISFIVALQFTLLAQAGHGILGYANSGQTQRCGLAQGPNTGGNVPIRINYPTGSTNGSNNPIIATCATGVDYVIACTITATNAAAWIMSNGQLLGSSLSNSITATNSTYSSQYLGFAGVQNTAITNPGFMAYWGGVSNIAFTTAMVESLGYVGAVNNLFFNPNIDPMFKTETSTVSIYPGILLPAM